MIGQSPIHNMVKDQPCLLGSNLSSLTDAKATLLEIVGAVEISPMECGEVRIRGFIHWPPKITS